MTLRKELTIGEKAAAASRAAVASSAAKLEAAEKKVDELEARIVALTKEQKQLEADCTTWKVCRVCLCFDWMLFRRKQNKTDDLFVFVFVSVEWFPSRCRRALVPCNDGAPLFVLHSPQPRHLNFVPCACDSGASRRYLFRPSLPASSVLHLSLSLCAEPREDAQ